MLLGIWWLWWAIGTFGLVGTGLMLWLAPAFLVQIVTWLLKFFFTTRIGAAILAGSVAFFVADVNRSLRDEAEYKQRTALFEHAQKARDARIAQDTRDQVWKEIADQTAANTVTDNQVKDFHDALPPVEATDKCADVVRVGSNANRLLNIAGGGSPQGRSKRLKGVPKARPRAASPANQRGH
jgi:cytochrome c-type biogenesis protein CcmH/NrfF